ncbi:hypothetical protein ACEPAG_4534 [Sanghuangporus baumii]
MSSTLEQRIESLVDLTGSNALVTGGGTGIGLMISKGLAGKGAKVYITGRRMEVLEKVISEFDDRASIIPIQMDVTNKASIANAVQKIEEADGKLNVLVNNAGITGPGYAPDPPPNDIPLPDTESIVAYGKRLFEQTSEDWDVVARTNVAASFFVTTAFLGLLAKGAEGEKGRIASVINISSISGWSKLNWGFYAYDCSKAALSHFTRVFATDMSLKRAPVRVNGISPGPFPSQLSTEARNLEQLLQTNFLGSPIPPPLRRAGREEEIAALAVYLASPISDYVTGQDIIIDGGFALVNP